MIDRLVPTPIVDSDGWEGIAVGGFHTCGLHIDQVKCWGSNAFGALGDGTTIDRSFPVPMDTDVDYAEISAGRHSTLVIEVPDLR